ncbi:MAG: hypothetical protein Fur0041_10050 [Bacteroidia bacterium]
MVKFMGPFELKKGERKVHNFMMPQYIGSVRVMVIAGQNFAYGHAEKAVPVRKPLMILGTLPRVAGPGETVDLPVNVFAMEKKVKNVNISVTTNNFFTVQGNSTQSVSFTETGDKIVTFRLNVAKAIGVGKVKITATGAGEKSDYSVEMDIRNPNPPMVDAYEAVIDPGQSWDYSYTPIGIAGTNKATLEISTIPPLNLGERLNYLIAYPHGCIEQTTSAAFPQLYLADLIKLDNNKKVQTENNIKAAINRLRSFQTTSGGLAYWPGDDEPSEWGSNYAGHFLLEAEAKGYAVPSGLLDSWKKFQRDQALNWSPHYDRRYYWNDDLIQAYRLYTLALAHAPELGAMNRMKEQKSLSIQAKWRLAAAYQLAGQTEVAKQIVNGISYDIKPYSELSFTYGSAERDLSMILETMSLIGGTMRTKAAPVAKQVSEKLNQQGYWMSTQSTAYSLIALCKFSAGDKTTPGVNCDYTVNGKKTNVTGKERIVSTDIDIKGTAAGKVAVKNKGSNTLFVRLVLQGTPEPGNETDSESNLGMDVYFTAVDGSPIDITKIEQGTDFIATVTVSNTGMRGEYKELALSQIFPSGWEIRNTRMEEGPSNLKNDSYDYQDIRDDRVYTYFWLGPNKSRTYRIQLNASYSGHFYMPAFYCEAMYDKTINARKAGKWVDVVPFGVYN